MNLENYYSLDSIEIVSITVRFFIISERTVDIPTTL